MSPVEMAAENRRIAAAEAVDLCAKLSPRERDILTFSAKGYTHAEIGGLLHLAPKTVEHYVRTALVKLGVSRSIEAVVIVVKGGLV